MKKICIFLIRILSLLIISCSKNNESFDPEVEKWKNLSASLIDSALVFSERGLHASARGDVRRTERYLA